MPTGSGTLCFFLLKRTREGKRDGTAAAPLGTGLLAEGSNRIHIRVVPSREDGAAPTLYS